MGRNEFSYDPISLIMNPYKKLQGRIFISFNDIQCLILYDSLLFRPELAENSSKRRRNTCFEPVRIIIRTVLSRRFVVEDDFFIVAGVYPKPS